MSSPSLGFHASTPAEAAPALPPPSPVVLPSLSSLLSIGNSISISPAAVVRLCGGSSFVSFPILFLLI
ncbi:hypothetical protein TSUD_297240 [Trifolium subterraneum]|uniref:Uncharacterized protein n=1 Tax=Trifolium subterraneum TaxID=3900 RepID=A0A2Z6N7V1_TRISU|nr:hypothetical protein TSUD_297240 [Trifolium subterraneum]